tara:strand:- start:179 stop:442 length:264 start_codon:yes stop_codon:yes gene_type:complete
VVLEQLEQLRLVVEEEQVVLEEIHLLQLGVLVELGFKSQLHSEILQQLLIQLLSGISLVVVVDLVKQHKELLDQEGVVLVTIQDLLL